MIETRRVMLLGSNGVTWAADVQCGEVVPLGEPCALCSDRPMLADRSPLGFGVYIPALFATVRVHLECWTGAVALGAFSESRRMAALTDAPEIARAHIAHAEAQADGRPA